MNFLYERDTQSPGVGGEFVFDTTILPSIPLNVITPALPFCCCPSCTPCRTSCCCNAR